MMKRKEFIKSTAMLAAAGMIYKANAFSPPQETLKVGLIGVKGMGWANLMALLKQPNVQCTALCDVDERVLDQRIDELRRSEEHTSELQSRENLVCRLLLEKKKARE